MIKKFLEQSWLYFKGDFIMFNFYEFLMLEVMNPFLTLILYCMVAAYSFHTKNLADWVIGNSFLLCVTNCIYAAGLSFNQERRFGRIRTIIISPYSKAAIIFEKGFFRSLISAVTVLCGFFLASTIFSVDYSNVNMILFILNVIVAMYSTMGFGMLLGVIGLITDQIDMILNLSVNILILMSGANFPLSQLPYIVQTISYCLPLTHSISAASMLFYAFEMKDFIQQLTIEVLIGSLFYFVSFVLIKKIEKIAIKNSTLEIF